MYSLSVMPSTVSDARRYTTRERRVSSTIEPGAGAGSMSGCSIVAPSADCTEFVSIIAPYIIIDISIIHATVIDHVAIPVRYTTTRRAPPLVCARGRLTRTAHEHPRRDNRQRGSADDTGRPALLASQSDLGRQWLPDQLRQLPAAGWSTRR